MLEVNFNPFPVLSTERLLLREITEADVDAIFQMRSDKNVMQFKRSEYIQRTAKEMVDNCVETLGQIKHIHSENMKAPKPR